MYDAGRRLLGLPTEECLFVDDSATLVEAAVALGYQGRIIDRRGEAEGHELAIRSLMEVLRPF